jgi:ankyrin repeat protein
MLDLGWNMEAVGDWGGTALHHAACEGHLPVAKLLLARGASLDHKQVWKGDVLQTALHGASNSGHKNGLAMVELVAGRMRDSNLEPYIQASRQYKNTKITRLLEKLAGSDKRT